MTTDRPRGNDRLYRGVIRTALALFRLLGFRFTIDGAEHVPDTGGAVIASSHVSYFDFMFVGLAAHPKRRLVRFMAKKSVFDSKLSGWLMRGMHHIPVDRGAGASSYTLAVEALRRGELVGVFPESTISRSFVPRAFKSGAVRMAMEAGVPLLPMVTWGGQRVWTAGRRPRLHRRVPVTIAVGTPLAIGPRDKAHEVTERLHAAVSELADQVQRAYPTPAPAAAAEAWWQPAHLGGSAPTVEEAAAIDLAASQGRLARSAARRR